MGQQYPFLKHIPDKLHFENQVSTTQAQENIDAFRAHVHTSCDSDLVIFPVIITKETHIYLPEQD